MSTTLSPVNPLTQLHINPTYPLPGTARVAVVGEVDLATAPVLRDRLLTVLHDQAPAVLDVDLAEVTSWTAPGSARWSPCVMPPCEPDARCGSPARSRSCAGYWT